MWAEGADKAGGQTAKAGKRTEEIISGRGRASGPLERVDGQRTVVGKWEIDLEYVEGTEREAHWRESAAAT